MIIIVTGTPGVGKTLFSLKLAKKLKSNYLDLNFVIDHFKLKEKYDRKLKTFIVDTDKLVDKTVEFILGNKKIVIDSHMSHYIDKKYVDKCYVLNCDLKVLAKRLEKRGYTKLKIRDNLDAEIFDVCGVEAEEIGHKVIRRKS